MLSVAGVALVSVAIGTCLMLGTFGWFALGFGMMTDCTNNYGCTETGCTPCATTGRWINAGGLAQLVLAGIGVVVVVLGLRANQRAFLVVVGAALLAMSTLTIVGTTWRAQESYCQPGTPGYISSYCSTDD
jgi:hypothetical protein